VSGDLSFLAPYFRLCLCSPSAHVSYVSGSSIRSALCVYVPLCWCVAEDSDYCDTTPRSLVCDYRRSEDAVYFHLKTNDL